MLEKYLQQIKDITSRPGVFAYRGQSRAGWPLHSAATRRLAKSLGLGALNDSGFSQVYIDYHRETLIEPARTRGFGVESGRDISDLQLLAKLQHFEAATGLLDFSWSPLIALWFASREADSDGKVFVLNVNDPIHVARVTGDLERRPIDAALSRAGNEPGLLYWEPMWSGDAMPRILRQRGVFIIGRPFIPIDGQTIGEIEILEGDKTQLLEELALLDTGGSSLFPDVYGFASSEGVKAPTLVRTSQFFLIRGNQHIQAGNYKEAIDAYDRCINISHNVGELYFLRGNAKSEAQRYREAVDDYMQAIAHRDQPVLGLGRTENSAMFASLTFMAYYNCGNALAELSDYEGALRNYSKAIEMDEQNVLGRGQVLFNRGNAYLDLGQFGQAIKDYNEALTLQANEVSLGNILFNKANALVVLGKFTEALKCYRTGQPGDLTEAMVQNAAALEQVIDEIGERQHRIHFDKESNYGRLMRVAVYVDGCDDKRTWNVIFKGRTGNIGNFGRGLPGGAGFEGKMGFVVTIEGKN